VGQLDGKVAFITGGARGQGASHALKLAQEGADVVIVDICAPIPSVQYSLSTKDDLDATVERVQATGRRCLGIVADVRDKQALFDAVATTMATFGRLDIVVANAGIFNGTLHDHPDAWIEVIDVNLTGTWHTLQATVPAVQAGGRGGSIILTSSIIGSTGYGTDSIGAQGYMASKHGIVGLMRSYANWLGKDYIRVNTIHPTGVATPMIMNEPAGEYLASLGSAIDRNAIPVAAVEPEDVSNAVVWLASDASRYVTGGMINVDAGYINNA